MKKTLLTTALLAATTLAQAHELWVTSPATASANSQISGEIGYGHNFPAGEPIATERLAIFKPLEIIGMDGKRYEMSQKGENYQYLSKDKIPAGAYWLNAVYQPTFWSKNKDGWKMQNRKEMPDADTCILAQMYSKTLVVVGKPGRLDPAALAKPIGNNLEIIPLADPTQLKADSILPLQILYKGKPLFLAKVTATADTFVEKDLDAANEGRRPIAFSNTTGKDGKINVILSGEGLWNIRVTHNAPFEDEKTCMEHSNRSSLVVAVGSKRAAKHSHSD